MRPGERVAQHVDLALAAYERSQRRLLDVAAEPRSRCDGLPHRYRLALPLRLDRRRRPVLDHVRGRTVRRLANEDAVHRCRRLDAGRGVDDVSGHHALAFRRSGIERDEGLARVDRDPQRDAGLRRRVPDGEGRAYGTFRIVLVGDRGPEHRDDRIADELLDRAAKPLQVRSHASMMCSEHCPHVLGVASLGQSGRADEVGEYDRHDLPLLAWGNRSSEHTAAAGAEAHVVSALPPACGTGRHRRESTARQASTLHGAAHGRHGDRLQPVSRVSA